jgi:hypothetical protein
MTAKVLVLLAVAVASFVLGTKVQSKTMSVPPSRLDVRAQYGLLLPAPTKVARVVGSVRLRDAATDKIVMVGAGTYELETIRNPFGYDASWFVLKDTLIGGPQVYVRMDCSRGHDPNNCLIVQE